MRRSTGRARRALASSLFPLSMLGLLAATAAGGTITGTYGYFTSSASATMSLTEGGSVGLSWKNTPATGSKLMLDVGPLMPSDTAQRTADLANTGSLAINRVQLTIAGSAVGSTSDGVQLAIDRCSLPWQASATLFTCPGILSAVSPDRPVQANIVLAGSPAAGKAGLDHLRFTFRLPDSAPMSGEGLTGAVSITASGSRG